jgi:hypothetical protein
MVYSKFIEKLGKYLHSVRILKNYVSFDLTFPTSWILLKNYPESLEVMQNEGKDGLQITSFVIINDREKIDKLENIVDEIIKTNIEREEKEKLFKSKVRELQNIFEKENLENLKGLKFDIEELHKFMNNGHSEIDNGDTVTVKKA